VKKMRGYTGEFWRGSILKRYSDFFSIFNPSTRYTYMLKGKKIRPQYVVVDIYTCFFRRLHIATYRTIKKQPIKKLKNSTNYASKKRSIKLPPPVVFMFHMKHLEIEIGR
jgi:hypothetical protein